MTLPRRFGLFVNKRRLTLVWMSPRDRILAILGLLGTTVAAASVVIVGLRDAPPTVVTQFGETPVVAGWIVAVGYLGLALVAALLLRSHPVRAVNRWASGILLIALSAGMIEGAIRPIEASLDGLGWSFTAARILSWIALALGVAVISSKPSDHQGRFRLALAASGGFVLLAVCHVLALLGAAQIVPDTIRVALTNGLLLMLSQLSSWLILFGAWQVIEGLHATVDLGRASARKLTPRWVGWVLLAKVVMITVGFLLIPSGVTEEWDRARAALPFGWGYALVVALAAVTWVRKPIGPAVGRDAVIPAAVITVSVWMAPFLLGLSLVLLGTAAVLAVPSSAGDFASLGLLVTAVIFSTRWIRGLSIRSWWWIVGFGAGLVAVFQAPRASFEWSRTLEATLVSGATDIADWIVGFAPTWQTWSLLLLPFVALAWLATGGRQGAAVAALFVIGIWILPRTTSLWLESHFDAEYVPGLIPNLLMLDISLTIVAAWALYSLRRRGGSDQASARSLGLLVVVMTIVTFGALAVELAVQWVSEGLAAITRLDAVALAFVIPLVIPFLYTVTLDAEELNRGRSLERVFDVIGMSCLLFVIAAVLLSVGSLVSDTDDQLIRTITLPGLALVLALGIAVPSRIESREVV